MAVKKIKTTKKTNGRLKVIENNQRRGMSSNKTEKNQTNPGYGLGASLGGAVGIAVGVLKGGSVGIAAFGGAIGLPLVVVSASAGVTLGVVGMAGYKAYEKFNKKS